MALSTSRTVITQSGLTTTQTFNVGGIQAGVSNLHTIGYDVVDSNTGTGVTVRSTGNAVFSGVITASKFVGDISDATGGASGGLGTALSQTQTSPLNKIYFTDNVLSIGATITIDPPPSSTVAYTNYSDIKISSADLIIKDGDDFIPDILGLSTTSLRGRYTYN